MLLMLALTAHAYNVIDLPENMTFSDALGVFNADEITRITVSDIAEGKYTDLTKDEINEFYSTIQDMTVYRKINTICLIRVCRLVCTEATITFATN